MQKYKLWLLFFFAVFSGTLGMIIWTVVSAVNTPVHEDESFLSSYHNMDDTFNKIVSSNKKFLSVYNISFNFNSNKTDLEYTDIFSSRRVLDQQNKNKDMLKVGENKIFISLKDKNGNIVKDAKIDLKITRATNHNNDIFINNFKFNDLGYATKTKVDFIGNWNITGTVYVDGITGYLFLKTNTIKKM